MEKAMGTLFLGFPQKEVLFFCDGLPQVTDSLTNGMDIPSFRNREDRGADCSPAGQQDKRPLTCKQRSSP
jgi:hypothetical protein